MPDHLTPRTRRIMTLANDIALRHGLNEVTNLVVLIAILEERHGVAAKLLQALGIDLRQLYEHLPRAQADLRIRDLAKPVPASPECGRMLETAESVAAAARQPQVGTEHLLIAIAKTDGPTAVLLAEDGVTEEAIRQTASDFAT